MVRTRTAIAAAAIVVVASPIAWRLAQERDEAAAPRPAETPARTERPAPPPVLGPPQPVPSEPMRMPAIRAETPPAVAPTTPPAIEQEARDQASAPSGEAAAAASSDYATKPESKVTPDGDASGSKAPSPAPRRERLPGPRPADATISHESLAAAPPPEAKAKKPADPARAARVAELPRPAPALTRALPTRSVPPHGEGRLGAVGGYGGIASDTRIDTEEVGRDRFDAKPQSGFKTVQEAPVSTFSIDVDTASYGFLRASLAKNTLPPPDAVRIEELVNYFPYAYEAARSAVEPFKVTASVFPSPWAEGRKILRVGIKGYEHAPAARPPANLVFLIDTSGSMSGPNRLPLVKQSLALLLMSLDARDRVAIVAYAGQAGTVLEPTKASDKQKILLAIEGLRADGGTAGGEGLRQAYALAARNYDAGAVNRVMLATDGDFNIGIANRDELKGFVEREREKGIFLSVLGFGMGNYNDALMQALAQNGNGTAATIDTLNEARKVLVEEASATLFPIAKDVKIQVEFNPATTAEYRLIGYETRALNRDDFENDRVDAGEVGAGQSATALYEFVPKDGPRTVPPLRYGESAEPTAAGKTSEYAFVKLRYKLPKDEVSRLIETPVGPSVEESELSRAGEDARFAVAVAGFGEILRGGRWTQKFTLDDVLRLASGARGEDPYGYRSEFLQLVRAARTAQALQSSRP